MTDTDYQPPVAG